MGPWPAVPSLWAPWPASSREHPSQRGRQGKHCPSVLGSPQRAAYGRHQELPREVQPRPSGSSDRFRPGLQPAVGRSRFANIGHSGSLAVCPFPASFRYTLKQQAQIFARVKRENEWIGRNLARSCQSMGYEQLASLTQSPLYAVASQDPADPPTSEQAFAYPSSSCVLWFYESGTVATVAGLGRANDVWEGRV